MNFSIDSIYQSAVSQILSGINAPSEFKNSFISRKSTASTAKTEKKEEIKKILTTTEYTTAKKTTTDFNTVLNNFVNKSETSGDVDKRITDSIAVAAKKYDLDPNLIKAVIKQESSFNPKSVSSAGAMGLMQLMPKTAELLGVNDAFNIEENIDGGSKFLKEMLKQFDGNLELALAAYNAGPNAVKKYGGIPPYSETIAYVPKVIGYKEMYTIESQIA